MDTSYAPKGQSDKLRKSLEKTVSIRWPVDITSGKCIVEARLRFIHKGQIARHLAQEIKPDFVLCAGDDLTDEGNAFLLRVVTGYLLTPNRYVPSTSYVRSATNQRFHRHSGRTRK